MESLAVPTLLIYAEHGKSTTEQKNRFVESGRNATRVDLAGVSPDAHLDAFDQWIVASTGCIIR